MKTDSLIDTDGVTPAEVLSVVRALFPDFQEGVTAAGYAEFESPDLSITVVDDPGDIYLTVWGEDPLPVFEALTRALPSASLDLSGESAGVLATRRP